MNLKNYTSTVPAITSIGRIEMALVEAGASDINKRYENGICVAISFRMVVKAKGSVEVPMFFKLPARVSACFDVLWKEVKRPQAGTKEAVGKQAERTAWKIVCDWVEVQLSMILLQQAEPMQVFLPYAYNPVTDKTFFEQVQESNFKLLNSGNQPLTNNNER